MAEKKISNINVILDTWTDKTGSIVAHNRLIANCSIDDKLRVDIWTHESVPIMDDNSTEGLREVDNDYIDKQKRRFEELIDKINSQKLINPGYIRLASIAKKIEFLWNHPEFDM